MPSSPRNEKRSDELVDDKFAPGPCEEFGPIFNPESKPSAT